MSFLSYFFFNDCSHRWAEGDLSGRIQTGLSEAVGMYSDKEVIEFSEFILFPSFKRNPPHDEETFRRSLYQVITL